MNLDYIYAALPLPIRSPLKRIMMASMKPKLKTFYSQFVFPGALIFDIGANDGDYSEIFIGLGGKVIAVEPQPTCFTKLQEKFKGKKKIKIISYGIGAKKETANFHISSFNNPNSSFSTDFMKKSRYNYRTWDTVIKVPMVTLNHLIQEYGLPHFCKIDVEGYEWEVLSALKKPIPVISFEFIAELNDKTIKSIKHLDTLGKAEYNLCLGMSYRFALDEWITGKELIKLLTSEKAKTWNGDIYVKFANKNS